MITHKYTGDGGRFYVGLPARDLDIEELNGAQKAMLYFAVQEGLYEEIEEQADEQPHEDSQESEGEETDE